MSYCNICKCNKIVHKKVLTLPSNPKKNYVYYLLGDGVYYPYTTDINGNLIPAAGGGTSSGVNTVTSVGDTITVTPIGGGGTVNIEISQDILDQINEGGATDFDELTDTPNDKTTFAGQVPFVNTAENALVYDFADSGIYQGLSPSTVTVNNISSGTDISNYSIRELVQNIYAPYTAPSFSSFSIQGQSTTVEVGTTISGNKNFSFSFNQSQNVQANSLDIIDVTGGSTIATSLPLTSPQAVNVGSVTKTSAISHSWRGSAENTQGSNFNSSNFTVNWRWRVYYGTSASDTIDETGIEALPSSSLKSNENGTYNFVAGNYKYIAYPNTFGSPTATTGFKDTATNLSVAMADATDNAFFSNTQNGWSYGLVTVTNTNGVTTNYRVYRTKNVLGGSINIQVS